VYERLAGHRTQITLRSHRTVAFEREYSHCRFPPPVTELREFRGMEVDMHVEGCMAIEVIIHLRADKTHCPQSLLLERYQLSRSGGDSPLEQFWLGRLALAIFFVSKGIPYTKTRLKSYLL